MKRRDEKTMMALILQIANDDQRIRAVVMNGSRTSPSAKKDIFQDYDIVYVVTDVEGFVRDNEWYKSFGPILIMQKPDEMDGNWEKNKNAYGYLLQFTDRNRIDLTLLHKNQVPSWHKDSQSLLLLDKDNMLGEYPPPSDKDYLPKPPTKKQFLDCCNEFLWVATYVAKGICRKELTYAKYTAEHVVKEELIKLLCWYAAIKTNFQKTMGFCGKNLEQYLEPELWDKFKKTYVDADYKHLWEGLFLMCDLFNDLASNISTHFDYSYNVKEYHNVVRYLQDLKTENSSKAT